MTLAFSQKFPDGTPTFFVEKIWQSLLRNGVVMKVREMCEIGASLPSVMQMKVGDFPTKIHTIRKDEKNRWHKGRKIHYVINNRTKDRLQFAPVVPCLNTQAISIVYDTYLHGDVYQNIKVTIDKKTYHAAMEGDGSTDLKVVQCDKEIKDLAINDGFDSVEAFFKWFSEDYEGKIIHWTDYVY